MRPTRLLAAVLSLCALAPAFAAVDDQFAPSSPMSATPALASPGDAPAASQGFAAAARSVVAHVMAGAWRLSLGTPYAARAAVAQPVVAGDTAASATEAETLGARWRVLHGDANSHVPVAAWMPDMQNADARSAVLRPTMNLSGEWALPDDFSLGVMPGIAVDYSALGRRQSTGTFALTLGKSWSPQWRTFVDMARDRSAATLLSGVSTSLDAGVTFVATRFTQIDFAVTHGLSDTAPVFQAGLGLSSSF